MRVDVTDSLDCGCPALRNAIVLGLDAEHVPGVVAADPAWGELWVHRHVLEPELAKRVPRGTVVDRAGMEIVRVVAPFELHCKRHPRDTEAWRVYEARRRALVCPRHHVPIGDPGEVCPLCVEEW